MAMGQISEFLQNLRRAALGRDEAGLTDGQLLDVYVRFEGLASAMAWAVYGGVGPTCHPQQIASGESLFGREPRHRRGRLPRIRTGFELRRVVGGWTKYGRLSNLAAWDAEELGDHVVMALVDLKYQPRILNAFIKEAGLPVAA